MRGGLPTTFLVVPRSFRVSAKLASHTRYARCMLPEARLYVVTLTALALASADAGMLIMVAAK